MTWVRGISTVILLAQGTVLWESQGFSPFFFIALVSELVRVPGSGGGCPAGAWNRILGIQSVDFLPQPMT
jgi:hypothetical protein